MRGIPTEVLALLNQRLIKFGAAHKIYSDPIARVWSGHWPLDVDGEEYLPLGATNLAQDFHYQIGQVANGITVALSSLDPTLAPRVLTTEFRGCDVEVRLLFFNNAGVTLLHSELDFYGSVDRVTSSRIPGGLGTVVFALESEAQGVKRGGGRLGADADQRRIVANDGARKYQSVASNIELVWDGRPPVRSVGLRT